MTSHDYTPYYSISILLILDLLQLKGDPQTFQDLNIIIAQYHIISEEHRRHNSTFVNRFVCFYFPVVRLMAVEDELRGGAMPDIKPRILTDQVCACVFTSNHFLNQFASYIASHPGALFAEASTG